MKILLIVLLAALSSGAFAVPEKYKGLVKFDETDDTIPTVALGANVFYQRCSLCHGTQGMGEGRVPLKIKSYPSTNIMIPVKAQSHDDLFDIVVYGGLMKNVDRYMPPFGNELTWTELQSVVEFVSGLRRAPEEHLRMLADQKLLPSELLSLGKTTYENRCTLCHGVNADGNGRMAKIIKNPPPYNLLASMMPEAYLKQIIAHGGESVGRSKQMPPWGNQLSDAEIDAVVSYIIDLRPPMK